MLMWYHNLSVHETLSHFSTHQDWHRYDAVKFPKKNFHGKHGSPMKKLLKHFCSLVAGYPLCEFPISLVNEICSVSATDRILSCIPSVIPEPYDHSDVKGKGSAGPA